MMGIDKDMLLGKYMRKVKGIKRSQASIVVKLCTGHIPLNEYLHQILKVDLPRCLSCNYEQESIHHFHFDCPTWRHERWYLAMNVGKEAKSMSNLINSTLA